MVAARVPGLALGSSASSMCLFLVDICHDSGQHVDFKCPSYLGGIMTFCCPRRLADIVSPSAQQSQCRRMTGLDSASEVLHLPLVFMDIVANGHLTQLHHSPADLCVHVLLILPALKLQQCQCPHCGEAGHRRRSGGQLRCRRWYRKAESTLSMQKQQRSTLPFLSGPSAASCGRKALASLHPWSDFL